MYNSTSTNYKPSFIGRSGKKFSLYKELKYYYLVVVKGNIFFQLTSSEDCILLLHNSALIIKRMNICQLKMRAAPTDFNTFS